MGATTPDGAVQPLLNPDVPVPEIDPKDLPHCPSCKTELLRPGVVWFGEPLDEEMLSGIDDWIAAARIDVMIVVGTSGQVHPAAAYVNQAKRRGARVVLINPDPESLPKSGLGPDDFWFTEDAATILPQLMSKIVDTSS